MSRRARWKISRDKRKEESALGQAVKSASDYQAKEKSWSKGMGMLGALLVPMAVASTVATGGAALPMWAGMLAAGAGSLVGSKLGEEAAEASEAGGFVLGEDKYSGGKGNKFGSSKQRGKNFRDGLKKGKFTRALGVEASNALVKSADDMDKGMLKDAAVAAVATGIKDIGGIKGLKETVKGGGFSTFEATQKTLGMVAEDGTKQGFKKVGSDFLKGKAKGVTLGDKTKAVFSTVKEGLTKGNIPLQENMGNALAEATQGMGQAISTGDSAVLNQSIKAMDGVSRINNRKAMISNVVNMGGNLFEGATSLLKKQSYKNLGELSKLYSTQRQMNEEEEEEQFTGGMI